MKGHGATEPASFRLWFVPSSTGGMGEASLEDLPCLGSIILKFMSGPPRRPLAFSKPDLAHRLVSDEDCG